MFLAEKEFDITSAIIPSKLGVVKTVDGKTKDYSLIDPGTLRKQLVGRLDGTLIVFVTHARAIDSQDIVFRGNNLVAAVAAYNGLG